MPVEDMASYMREYRAKRRGLKWKLKDKPCADCGVKYPPWVMQFDHLRDKEFTISKTGGRSEASIIAEVEKCDVVCANCHAERSYRRNAL